MLVWKVNLIKNSREYTRNVEMKDINQLFRLYFKELFTKTLFTGELRLSY